MSGSVLERLPIYLHFLNGENVDGDQYVSSAAIAKGVKLGEVQVRKDLQSVSGAGRPKLGYKKSELVAHLKAAIMHGEDICAVIVGAGKMGKALLSFEGFGEYGVKIIAAFDSAAERLGEYYGKPILSVDKLNDFVKENGVKIGVITVPEKSAQSSCDMLVKSGIKAIWNFAPTRLNVPPDVVLRNENLAASLAVVSLQLKNNSEL